MRIAGENFTVKRDGKTYRVRAVHRARAGRMNQPPTWVVVNLGTGRFMRVQEWELERPRRNPKKKRKSTKKSRHQAQVEKVVAAIFGLKPFEDFVWYKGKVWLYEGHPYDRQGRHMLSHPFDTSLAISAPLGEIQKVTDQTKYATLQAIAQLYEAATDPRFRGRRHNPRAPKGADIFIVWHYDSEITEFRAVTAFGKKVMEALARQRKRTFRGATKRRLKTRTEWIATTAVRRAKMVTDIVIFGRAMGATVMFKTLKD